jgi:hypothetical protein
LSDMSIEGYEGPFVGAWRWVYGGVQKLQTLGRSAVAKAG